MRYNTDTLLTLMPVWVVSFRAGYNHNTHEGPSYSTIHQGGDVQEYAWFRNAQDTYVGGLDVKLTQRSSLSYDQFLVYYRGDTSYEVTAHAVCSAGGHAGERGRQPSDNLDVRNVGHVEFQQCGSQRRCQSVLQRNVYAKRSSADADEFPDRAGAFRFALRTSSR